MNILFLGGAKRVSMARKFKKAAYDRCLDCKIFGYELCKEVPLAIEGEIFVGKRWSDPDVVDHILALCRQHEIRIVIPFVDAAVTVARRVTEASEDAVFSPTGRVERIEAMFDKVTANEVFTAAQLPVPEVYTDGPVTFPLIAKPRHGSASKGLVYINNDKDLATVLHDRDNYLIQRRFDRRVEYTADCYVSVLDGEVLVVVVRRRDEVAGGEVVRTTVLHNKAAQTLASKTLVAAGLTGAVTVQLIEDLDTGRLMVMEVNPRLGGGAVASALAGADIPAFITDEARGCWRDPCLDWRDCTVTRYLDEKAFYN